MKKNCFISFGVKENKDGFQDLERREREGDNMESRQEEEGNEGKDCISEREGGDLDH